MKKNEQVKRMVTFFTGRPGIALISILMLGSSALALLSGEIKAIPIYFAVIIIMSVLSLINNKCSYCRSRNIDYSVYTTASYMPYTHPDLKIHGQLRTGLHNVTTTYCYSCKKSTIEHGPSFTPAA